MDKLKNIIIKNIKENKYIYITFLIASFIFFAIYSIKNIIPIGYNTLLTVDFYHQYGPLLSELYDKIKIGDNLIYSFNTGLGLPFFRNFFNYLSSPFNIIMLLFPRNNIVTSFSIIIASKIIIASCIMTYFLKKFFNKNSILITIFGITYGFSSYFVAFYWNIMWLDSLIFLPLVILGVKQLIDKDKINLYVISLFLSIIANYFITYMICIFTCLFFLIYIIFKENITRKELIHKILLFTISSLIAGGLAGFMLFPYVSSLKTISATGDSFTFSKTFNFNFIYFLANHFSLVKTIVFSSQDYFLPNVSSGILIFTLLFAFFFNGKIKLKHKIMTTIFLLILIISFCYVPLDFIWHGFHTPNDLPFRYSFIYIFIINTIAFYSLENIKSIKIKYLVIIFLLMSLFLMFLSYNEFLTKFAFEINMIFLLILLILVLLYKFKQFKFTKYILIIIVFFDIILNIKENWTIDHDKDVFMNNYENVNSVVNDIKKQDDSFYRIVKNFNQTLNDGAWYNYNGISIFSSVAYEQMAKAQKNLGIPGNNVNSYYYRQNTPVYNSIMGIKYFIGLETQNPLYSKINTINYYDIYKNPYYLPPAFAVNSDIKNWENNNSNPFVNQQTFVKNATNIEDLFEVLEIDYDTEQTDYAIRNDQLLNLNFDENKINANLTVKTKESGNVYVYIYNYDLNDFRLNYKYYSITKNEPYIIDAGFFEEDEEINIEIDLNPKVFNVTILAYQIDQDKFEQFYNILNSSAMQITNFSNNMIDGMINVDEDKTIFTSINYDEGFEIFVDNKKVDTFKIANSFLAFDIEKGSHSIKIVYKIPHIKVGLITSLLSLGLFIFINIIKKTKKNA